MRMQVTSDPEHWFGDPDFRARVLAGLDGMFGAAVRSGLAASMYLVSDGCDGADNGHTLSEIAARERLSVTETAYWLLQRAGPNFGTVMIVENWVKWDDLVAALADPDFLIMGDGTTSTLDGPGARFQMCPSDWGYTARFLSQFVRDMKLCSLDEAVSRMSSGPARQLGLKDRGRIATDLAADIVVFDLDTMGTAVSPSSLSERPSGIEHVLVNGQFVFRVGELTDALPGRVGRH
jgi:N-acyl-D-amino-acid deacylase